LTNAAKGYVYVHARVVEVRWEGAVWAARSKYDVNSVLVGILEVLPQRAPYLVDVRFVV
jgi:hypothetical protein